MYFCLILYSTYIYRHKNTHLFSDNLNYHEDFLFFACFLTFL